MTITRNADREDQGSLPAPSLENLAEVANREHLSTIGHVRMAVEHAILAGEAIHEAHNMVLSKDEWQSWCEQNLIMGRTMASNYERIYVYRERLPNEAFESHVGRNGHEYPPSMKKALTYLTGLPKLAPRRRWGLGDDVISEIKRLHTAGMSRKEIAELLGISIGTVRLHVVPGALKRDRAKHRALVKERYAAARALTRQRNAAELKRSSAGLAEVYALTRRALQIAQSEYDASGKTAARRRIGAVITTLHQAEDQIGAVLRDVEADGHGANDQAP